MEREEKRGVKRKRRPTENLDDVPSRLRAKLHHGLKEVKKATKKVKAFETQRLVKKLKDARKGGDESNTKSLEVQLECLKHIDLDQIAIAALRSKIKKDPFLPKDINCQEAFSAELTLPQKEPVDDSSARELVESRMLSSKILSTEVTDVIQILKHVLGVGGRGTPSTGDNSDASDAERSEKSERDKPVAAKMKAPLRKRKDPDEERRRVVTNNEVESGEEGNDDASWTGFDGVHSGESEQSDDAEDAESSSNSQTTENHSSISDNVDSVAPGKLGRKKKERRSTISTEKAKAGQSTFLPSLSVGFISGTSDSEWSDAESKIADLPVKKNRRGQRARKAIWEKKYGRNANHLRKQREHDVRDAVRTAYGNRSERGRPRGGSAARGGIVRARSPSTTRKSHASSHPHSKPSPSNQGRHQDTPRRNHNGLHQVQGYSVGDLPSNVHPFTRNRVDDNKPMHPSWEAKRRLKEKESPAIVPSTGTRIKFT